jgi:hypothetical protein
MTEISRRAVLGSAVAGAAVSALPAAPALAAPGRAVEADAAPDPHHAGWLDDKVSWPDFLAGADINWTKMPKTWYEGPFLGNGFLGSGI